MGKLIDDPDLFLRACTVALKAHNGQKRKYTHEPYFSHPLQVAGLVISVGGSVNMVCAALLHDVVEDTEITLEQLVSGEMGFNEEIKELVYWLTDKSKPEDGKRSVRKAIDREHISKAPASAKTIKLADLISNTPSIVKHDQKFAKIYMQEKRLLLDVLKEGDDRLYTIAKCMVDGYFQKQQEKIKGEQHGH